MSQKGKEKGDPAKVRAGAGEMAERLRALAAVKEDVGLIPSTHLEAHNCRPRGSNTLFWPPGALHTSDAQTNMETPTHIKIN